MIWGTHNCMGLPPYLYSLYSIYISIQTTFRYDSDWFRYDPIFFSRTKLIMPLMRIFVCTWRVNFACATARPGFQFQTWQSEKTHRGDVDGEVGEIVMPMKNSCGNISSIYILIHGVHTLHTWDYHYIHGGTYMTLHTYIHTYIHNMWASNITWYINIWEVVRHNITGQHLHWALHYIDTTLYHYR